MSLWRSDSDSRYILHIHLSEHAKYGKDVVLTKKGDGCYDMAFKFSLLYKEGIVWRKALPETTVNPLRFMRKC